MGVELWKRDKQEKGMISSLEKYNLYGRENRPLQQVRDYIFVCIFMFLSQAIFFIIVSEGRIYILNCPYSIAWHLNIGRLAIRTECESFSCVW